MSRLTWLHLSDWHQKGKDFNRQVVRDALIKEIENRAKCVDSRLEKVDFIVFSGDAAQSGKKEEFEAAKTELFDPVLAACGLDYKQFIIVPGNHDLDNLKFKFLPGELLKPFESNDKIKEWLTDEESLYTLLGPFKEYGSFIRSLGIDGNPSYASVRSIPFGDKTLAFLGLNSALMCGRNKDSNGKVDDYGKLTIGEHQIDAPLKQIEKAFIRFTIMHHPFEYLQEFDKERVEKRIGDACHFVLCGHGHRSKFDIRNGTSGHFVLIPTGTAFSSRTPEDIRYTNAYNFVHLDFDSNQGTVFFRAWNDPQDKWDMDIGTYTNGQMDFSLPKELGKPLTEKKKPSHASLSVSISSSTATGEQIQKDEEILLRYLDAVIREHKDLDPRGIKQTKVQCVLPLDEIYVALKADKDRPGSDRRMMLEELDEIRKRLDLVEDPKEREKQYHIWATQTRIMRIPTPDKASRMELHEIVQHYPMAALLGDPGSGKTTLLRYLALQFARHIRDNIDLFLESSSLTSEATLPQIPGLGAPLFPIYIKISRYADARNPKTGGDPNISLIDFLPLYCNGMQIPDSHRLKPLFQRFLEQGQCLVLLDGLDEIVEPTDRKNIADAINRFAGIFGSNPSLTPSKKTSIPIEIPGEQEESLFIENAPPASDSIYNRFVVTSRIAGYHFAPLSGDFEVFTLCPMEMEDIQLFLEKWCPAVECHNTREADSINVKRIARREIDGIMKAVTQNPGVRRMASNPLMLRILAIIHRNEAHLPQRRVELYETAAITLLRDWNLQRELRVSIDEIQAMSLLGTVALWTHENRASGLITRQEAREIMGVVLACQHGIIGSQEMNRRLSNLAAGQDDALLASIPLDIRQAVDAFLETVRQHSGLYVERGEGLFGFMHLTFQEYFAARHLVSEPGKAKVEIVNRLHQPRWRELILLAVGYLSRPFPDYTDNIIQSIIDAGSTDPYESVLHRNLLFAAACVGDSLGIYPWRRKDMANRLIDIYLDRDKSGRYKSLQDQIKNALRQLCNDQGDPAVERALADKLKENDHPLVIISLLELVDAIDARSKELFDALQTCFDRYTIPGLHHTLHAMKKRMPSQEESPDNTRSMGWKAHITPGLSRFMGILWYDRWRRFLSKRFELPKIAIDKINEALQPVGTWDVIRKSRELIPNFKKDAIRDTDYWNRIYSKIYYIAGNLSIDPTIKVALYRLTSDLEIFSNTVKNLDWKPLYIFQKLSNVQLTDREKSQPDESIEEAVSRFESIIISYEEKLKGYSPVLVLERAGTLILEEARKGDLLAPYFAKAAETFPILQSLIKGESIDPVPDDAIKPIGDAVLDMLDSTEEFGLFREIVLFFSTPEGIRNFGIEREWVERVICILISLSEGENEKKRRWALQLLAEPGFHGYIQLSEEQENRLIRMLDDSLDQALCTLRIFPVTPKFLSWCWKVIRNEEHPGIKLKEVRSKLEKIGEISGTASILELLEEGMRDPVLRSIATELIIKVDWEGMETLAFALRWLVDSNTQLRQAGARILYNQSLLNIEIEHNLKELPLEEYQSLSTNVIRHLLINDPLLPLVNWIESRLTAAGVSLANLDKSEEIRKLSRLLLHEEKEIRTAAAIALLKIDLLTLIFFTMVDAARSENQFLRFVAYTSLFIFGFQLPSDGSSIVLDELVKLLDQNKNNGNSYLTIMLNFTLSRVQYSHTFYLEKWLKVIADPGANEDEVKMAVMGLSEPGKLLEPALRFLLEQATRNDLPDKARKYSLIALFGNQSNPGNRYCEEWFFKEVIRLLSFIRGELKHEVIRLARWTQGSVTMEMLPVLLDIVKKEEDPTTRELALRSAGWVLLTARRLLDAPMDINNPYYPRIPDGISSLIDQSLSEITKFLSSPDTGIRSAAACALASVLQDDKDRMTLLEAHLTGVDNILQALVESISDNATDWEDNDYHDKTINQTVEWIVKLPVSQQERCIQSLMHEISKRLITHTADESTVESRVIISLLARLSDHLAPKDWARFSPFQEILELGIAAAKYSDSNITRQGGILLLGNLQYLSASVARVLFDACGETNSLHDKAFEVVNKFKRFDEESLKLLLQAVGDPSISVAWNAARLLGEWGANRSEEIGTIGREQVASQLLRLLDTPEAERTVYDFSKSFDGEKVGPLYDVLYDSLMRVIAGPNAEMLAHENREDH